MRFLLPLETTVTLPARHLPLGPSVFREPEARARDAVIPRSRVGLPNFASRLKSQQLLRPLPAQLLGEPLPQPLRLVLWPGDGPVNALDNALRKAPVPQYPMLNQFQLGDYKVRILNGNDGTAAVVRVLRSMTRCRAQPPFAARKAGGRQIGGPRPHIAARQGVVVSTPLVARGAAAALRPLVFGCANSASASSRVTVNSAGSDSSDRESAPRFTYGP